MKKVFLLLLCLIIIFSTSCKKSNQPEETENTISNFIADEKYAKDTGMNYLNDLFNENYEDAFNNYPHDSTMKNAVNPEQYKIIIEDLYLQNGEFLKFKGSETTSRGDYIIFTSGLIFNSGTLNANVVFDKKGQLAGINFSIYTFTEDILPQGIREIDIEFGIEEWKLPGKITLPEKEGIYPLLILVHGSGPNNMNETVGLNEPFKDIAYYLASKDLAVMRYDKRTYTHISKLTDLKEFTIYDETIDDASEAVKFASSLDYIDSQNIFVLGHSLGAYVMPRIALVTDEASGYIMASGIYSNLGNILPYQFEYLVNLDGTVTKEEQEELDQAIIQSYKIKNPQTIEEGEIVFGAYKAYWEDLASYDPVKIASDIEKPVFVIQGNRDYQVPVSEFELLKDNLDQKENFNFKIYEGLNHLLMFGSETPSPEDYYVKNTVYPPLLDDIVDFIKDNN